MAGNVRLDDFSVQVINALEDAVESYLHEACGEVVSQTQRNTRVDTGQLKGSWQYKVDGNTGTGEHALEGGGRQGGWAYKDAKGEWHFTRGKKPSRAFHHAFNTCKPKLIRRAEQVLKANME